MVAAADPRVEDARGARAVRARAPVERCVALVARDDDAVLPRIGDVLVAARGVVAYYDDRVADKKPQRMIGQHGSLTDQERIVPLIRLGAFAGG